MFNVKNISVEELHELLKSNEDIFLIDVREEFERRICNIGGQLMTYNYIKNNTDKIPKNKKVVIYCHYGERSFFIVNMLTDKYGFDNIYNLAEGINAWAERIDHSMKRY